MEDEFDLSADSIQPHMSSEEPSIPSSHTHQHLDHSGNDLSSEHGDHGHIVLSGMQPDEHHNNTYGSSKSRMSVEDTHFPGLDQGSTKSYQLHIKSSDVSPPLNTTSQLVYKPATNRDSFESTATSWSYSIFAGKESIGGVSKDIRTSTSSFSYANRGGSRRYPDTNRTSTHSQSHLSTPGHGLGIIRPIANFLTPVVPVRHIIPSSEKDWAVSEPCDEADLACMTALLGEPPLNMEPEEAAAFEPAVHSPPKPSESTFRKFTMLFENSNGSADKKSVLGSGPFSSFVSHVLSPFRAPLVKGVEDTHTESSHTADDNFHSHFNGDHSFYHDDAHANGAKVSNRTIKNAKWRRKTLIQPLRSIGNISTDTSAIMHMSRVDEDSRAEPCLSPMTKLSKDRLRRRQSGLYGKETTVQRDQVDAVVIDVPLSESTFVGVVIGGFYQLCFDNDMPVVLPPTSADKRIVQVVANTDHSLDLHLYISRDNTLKTVHLPSGWHCLRCSPNGYLVAKEPFSSRRVVCYYLSRHPLHWNTLATVSKHDVHVHDHGDDAVEGEGEEEDMMVGILGGTDNEEEGEEHEADTHSFDRSVPVNWSHPLVLSGVIPFLADNPVDMQSMSKVNKAWSISICRIQATTINDKQGHYTQWSQYNDLCKKYSWGAFLSSGACKDVFCIQNKGTNELSAIGISDLDDLSERGMESVTKQELEISVLCSNLVDLNICPNIVTIHSVFRSAYPGPSCHWLPKTSLWDQKFPNLSKHSGLSYPPFATPASANLHPTEKQMKGSKGNYQFTRMEFCSGGDMEAYVRRGVSLDLATVKILLFQMCYALYCTRDQLTLRHYDIKLLNFFVTHGSTLLTPSEVNTQDQKPKSRFGKDHSSLLGHSYTAKPKPIESVRLQIGFEDSMFEVPIFCDRSKPQLVKLADFGTSTINPATLGDFITADQVRHPPSSPNTLIIHLLTYILTIYVCASFSVYDA